MQALGIIVAVVADISALIGALIAVYKTLKKQSDKMNLITDGIRCQLRAQMMNTYYAHRNEKTIREYEMQDFIKCYGAYRELCGNSFVTEIYEKVTTWEVIQ